MDGLKLALGFLTIIPAGKGISWNHNVLKKAAFWFPLIGILIGLLVGFCRILLDYIYQVMLSSFLSLFLWVLLTGALHLDGLADSVDCLSASVPKEKRLEIMKDPRMGVFGGVGLFLALSIKGFALGSISSQMIIFILPYCAALARWIVLVVARLPGARSNGLGNEFSKGVTIPVLLFSSLPVIGLCCLIGWDALYITLVVFVISLLIVWFAMARIGGVTGDVMGLSIEMAEIVSLLGFSSLMGKI